MNLKHKIRDAQRMTWGSYCRKMRCIDLVERALEGVDDSHVNLWGHYAYSSSQVDFRLSCAGAPNRAVLAEEIVTRLVNSPDFVKHEVTRFFTPASNDVDTVVTVRLTLHPRFVRSTFPDIIEVQLDDLGPPPACDIEEVYEEVEAQFVEAHRKVAAKIVRCTDPLTGEIKEERVVQ